MTARRLLGPNVTFTVESRGIKLPDEHHVPLQPLLVDSVYFFVR